MGRGDPGAQTRQVLANLRAALERAGARLEDVVRTRIYVTDISQWEAIGRAHGEVFGAIRPATAMVEVSRLIDPDMLVEVIARLEPTFGAINLEDVKSPECFEVERKLRDRLNIPVFHDDQHGTAIVASAAIRNGLRVVGKTIDQVRLVASGAGAASRA